MKMRVVIDAQSFEVEVGDLSARPILATVDGDTFEVWPEANGTALAEVLQTAEPPLGKTMVSPGTAPEVVVVSAKSKVVAAPIPGVILTVNVKTGDVVRFGQELCVLEAMKMKNIIRANRAGKVAAVCISPGEQVKHNQTLLEYSE